MPHSDLPDPCVVAVDPSRSGHCAPPIALSPSRCTIGRMDDVTPDNDTANRTQGDGLADESVALEHAAERLSDRFPDVPREDIDRLVGEHSEEYADAPVRDFVPVLVEHEVKAELREGAEPDRRE